MYKFETAAAAAAAYKQQITAADYESNDNNNNNNPHPTAGAPDPRRIAPHVVIIIMTAAVSRPIRFVKTCASASRRVRVRAVQRSS